MRAIKKIEWTSKNGKHIEVEIEVIREVQDNIVSADGDQVNLGKQTVDMMEIVVKADGEFLTRDFHAPHPIDQITNGSYSKLVAAGVYARVGDAYINKEQYDLIMDAINEINAAETTDEYKAVKAQEDAREEAEIAAEKAAEDRYRRQLKNGLCPKCGTYCYGDCEANL